MIIRSIEFVTSAATKNQFIQDELPQIILSGRSNVGKSSFINAMLNNQKVARVSQTPGKTRLVNYIRINSQFYFVDLPGYGYAKVNHETLQAFKTRIETFLATSRSLRLAILLLDIRHMPTQDDMIMRNYLIGRGISILYVLTKLDKLSRSQALIQEKKIREHFGVNANERFITFSAKTKANRDLIWDMIESSLKSESEEIQSVGETVR